MSRLALRLVRTDDPPAYRLAPGRLRALLRRRAQAADRRRDVRRNMRLIFARATVSCADDDVLGTPLINGYAWQGYLHQLPRPIRRRAYVALWRYYRDAPQSRNEYPWAPLDR